MLSRAFILTDKILISIVKNLNFYYVNIGFYNNNNER